MPAIPAPRELRQEDRYEWEEPRLHSEYQQGPHSKTCLKSTQTAPGPGAREAPEGPPGVCAVCVQGSVPQGRVHEFWLIPEVQTLWHLLSPSLPVFPKETEGNICVTVFESKQLYQRLKLG